MEHVKECESRYVVEHIAKLHNKKTKKQKYARSLHVSVQCCLWGCVVGGRVVCWENSAAVYI